MYKRFNKLRLIKFKKILGLDLKDELLILDGKVSSQGFNDTAGSFTINCNDCIISPGFIDPQVNGLGKCSFWDFPPPSFKEIDELRHKLAFHGVVAFCPTLITASKEKIVSLIDYINSYIDQSSDSSGAKILGIHIEGVFISRFGVHDPSSAQKEITINKLKPFVKENVILFTLAPELDQSGAGIKFLQENGILVSIGHSNATYKEGKTAVKEHNLKTVTHMFNSLKGIEGFSHRDKSNLNILMSRLNNESSIDQDKDGIMLYLLKDKEVLCMVIADEVHVNKEVVKLLKDYKGNEHFSLASDMISTTFYNEAVSQGKLGGGQTFLDKCILNLINWKVATTDESLLAASRPIANKLKKAKDMGLGQISFDKEANIVIWDEKKNAVKGTIIGENVFLNYEL